MELVIKPFSGLPCELETFTINDKNADSMDFGDTYDNDTENTILQKKNIITFATN